MRLLQITTILRYGSGKVVTDLCCRLAQDGHEVHLVSTDSPDVPEWPNLLEQLEQARVRLHRIDTFKRDALTLWKSARALAVLLENEPFDGIHVHSGTPAYLAWTSQIYRKLCGPPIIGTLHGFTNRQRPAWIDAMDRFAWSRCASRIAVSEETFRIATTKGIACNGWILPGLIGAKASRFSSVETTDRPPSATQPPAIVCVGEIEPRKGQLDLVNALSIVAERMRKPISCHLVGGLHDTAYADAIRTQAGACARLILRIEGESPHPERRIEQADLCVYPTYSEGLGLSIIESIALGKDTLFSYHSGCKDIADRLALAHSTFAPGDIDAMADLIAIRLSHPTSLEERQRNAARAKRVFSSETFFRSYLDLYETTFFRPPATASP